MNERNGMDVVSSEVLSFKISQQSKNVQNSFIKVNMKNLSKSPKS